jgi:NAD(P)-dependent dehydrogenase (short-subunit alcohol dehydrogenase family)
MRGGHGYLTGIGDGIAGVLIKAGWRVFGSVRNSQVAAAAKVRHGERLHPLVFDVGDEEAVIGAAVSVRSVLGDQILDGLVNNAGIALSDPLMTQATSEFRRQIEVNLITPFVVTKAFAPLLGAREGPPAARGQIVNISSVGGRIGAHLLGAYAASKHGLEGISASLRREMTLYGVDVILVRPGFVAKPIWTKPRQ